MTAASTRRGRPPRQSAEAASTASAITQSTPSSGPGPEARRLAAAILEVLAGARSPSDTARALGLSLCRYYQLEQRALSGLVSACVIRRGRGRQAQGELSQLRRECERLKHECIRQQSLARAARRAVGLIDEETTAPEESKPKRRPRRPTARALRMAAILQQEAAGEEAAGHGSADGECRGQPPEQVES